MALVTVFQEEFVIEGEKSDTGGLCHDSEDKVGVVEDGVLTDVVSLLKGLEYENITFLVHDFQVYFAVYNEVDVLTVFFESQDLIAFLINHFLHMVLYLYEEVVRVAFGVEIVDLFQ